MVMFGSIHGNGFHIIRVWNSLNRLVLHIIYNAAQELSRGFFMFVRMMLLCVVQEMWIKKMEEMRAKGSLEEFQQAQVHPASVVEGNAVVRREARWKAPRESFVKPKWDAWSVDRRY
ncbi:uncharacterized protein LOC118349565 isoform X1 [Juglans regia]|uniref:Uncharacterized protein LOC118349565 isoform X1 n=1 Tax=Juglans regia TaxID=51240 RepID=A0A6P9ETJ4_JUGRE|nr:uncharacterized protein LOC118349565 isoform X1 [Juglans regia]